MNRVDRASERILQLALGRAPWVILAVAGALVLVLAWVGFGRAFGWGIAIAAPLVVALLVVVTALARAGLRATANAPLVSRTSRGRPDPGT